MRMHIQSHIADAASGRVAQARSSSWNLKVLGAHVEIPRPGSKDVGLGPGQLEFRTTVVLQVLLWLVTGFAISCWLGLLILAGLEGNWAPMYYHLLPFPAVLLPLSYSMHRVRLTDEALSRRVFGLWLHHPWADIRETKYGYKYGRPVVLALSMRSDRRFKVNISVLSPADQKLLQAALEKHMASPRTSLAGVGMSSAGARFKLQPTYVEFRPAMLTWVGAWYAVSAGIPFVIMGLVALRSEPRFGFLAFVGFAGFGLLWRIGPSLRIQDGVLVARTGTYGGMKREISLQDIRSATPTGTGRGITRLTHVENRRKPWAGPPSPQGLHIKTRDSEAWVRTAKPVELLEALRRGGAHV
jgi:hypothetical protein